MAIKNKLAAVMTVVILISPAFAMAADGQNQNSPTAADHQGSAAATQNFCTRLSDYSSRVTTQINENKDKLASNRDDRSKTLDDRQQQQNQKLQDLRNIDSAKRQSAFSQLEAMAKTDAQKQAVTQFENSVNAAIHARWAAVDAAIQAYQTGVKNIISQRDATAQTTEQNFENAVQAAINNAESQCSGGTAPATVRDTLNAALKAARAQFQTARKDVDKAGPQISALAQTRNAAVKKAMSDFQTALDQARIALKAAFAKSSSTTSSPTSGSSPATSGSSGSNSAGTNSGK